MKKVITRVLSTMGIGGVVLLAACANPTSENVGSSTAQLSSGPIKFSDSYCFTIDTTTYCYDNSAFVVVVSTPSGVTYSGARGSSRYREIDASGNTTYDDTLEYRTRDLSKDSIEKQFSQWFSMSTTAYGVTCTTSYQFFINDGDIKYQRSSTGCS